MITSVVPRHRMASEIENVTASIRKLYEDKQALELSPSSEQNVAERTCYDLRMGAHFIRDDELVGVDYAKKLLTEWLIHREARRTIISVVGEGGLAIVRNLYNKHKEDFDCYAWITVSHSFKEEHLLTTIQTLYENDGKKYLVENREKEVDKCNLTEKLRDYLQGKSYMIVFDDVWEINFWECMEYALPDHTNIRSRIIITTRDRGIAEFCRRSAPVHIHELKPLPADDALKLFLLKTFQFDHHGCPEDLNELSQRFVKRLCLLYFGLFPQDYSIKCSTLTQLWVAEGFVNENEMFGAQTLEEAAEDYLAELIRRSLVKVSNVFVNGKVKSCRVHDLMHDFIVRK
ncbi:hypothetical protein AHAS_Ahas17G0001100 [Arachis hypogaea]